MKKSLRRLKHSLLSVLCGLSIIFAAAFVWVNGGERVDTASADANLSVELPVIMYHSVVKDPLQTGKWAVTTDVFEEDLKYLQDNGYTTITASELLAYVAGEGDLPEKPVMLTFDDGYYNNKIHAKPILERYGMRAIISPIGFKMEEYSNIDDKNASYAYLCWEDLCDLQQSGTFEIGNHTYDLHKKEDGRTGVTRKKRESAEEHRVVLMEDVGRLQIALQARCGVVPVVFTYPFGEHDKESEKLLEEMGFQVIFTCYEKMNYIDHDFSNLLRLGRYNRAAQESTWSFMQRALHH